MKRKYKIIIIFIIIIYVGLDWIKQFNIQIHSLLGNILGVFVCSFPVWMLLYFLWKDEDISKTYRLITKYILFFWLFCYVVGTMAEIVMWVAGT